MAARGVGHHMALTPEELDYALQIAAKDAERCAWRSGPARLDLLPDLQQEAYLSILIHGQQYDGTKIPIKPWAHTVAQWGIGKAVYEFRRHKRHTTALERDDMDSDKRMYPHVLADYLLSSVSSPLARTNRWRSKMKKANKCVCCGEDTQGKTMCPMHLELRAKNRKPRRKHSTDVPLRRKSKEDTVIA